jgi:tyrosyl-tRNA synthetase
MMVDGEIGGNDQTFNMLAGRHLMKNLQNKEKFVISMKLLVTDKSGLKMSKSLGNFVALNDTPEDMFGKVMNFSDECLLNAFEICTFKTPEEIREYEKRLEAGENPRNIKLELAYEITKIFLGSAKYAEQGRKYFEDVIQNKEKPEEMKEIKPSEYNLCALLKEAGLVSSNSEVRRLVEQGGVKINDISAKDINDVVKNGDIVQKGKLNFVKVI